MNVQELLTREIENAPEPLVREVIDFARFLKARHGREQWETTVLSESALGKEWLSPEEDEAWQNL